jgi:hypothetical protein
MVASAASKPSQNCRGGTDASPARRDRARQAPMKRYASTTEQFRADARTHRIAELRAEDTTQIGHRPAPSEVAGLQNSLGSV